MGEVYRARDTRFGRDVAVKVPPTRIPGGPGRLARFEREARAVAALNHPNILTVHDVGTQAAAGPEGTAGGSIGHDVPFVVTEQLEGETLRELRRRCLPGERQALSLMLKAARGLEAAHAKGIVHRDLKPATRIRDDGRSGEGAGLRPRAARGATDERQPRGDRALAGGPVAGDGDGGLHVARAIRPLRPGWSDH
jgi:serine/threonine protein kinase